MIIDFDWLKLLYLLSWFIVIFYIRCNLLTCQHSLFTYGFFASDMHELQARIREKDERMAELMTLREELEAERRRAEELRLEMERSHEMEQSERQRLVCRLAAQLVSRENYRPFLNYNNCWCHCICDFPPTPSTFKVMQETSFIILTSREFLKRTHNVQYTTKDYSRQWLCGIPTKLSPRSKEFY